MIDSTSGGIVAKGLAEICSDEKLVDNDIWQDDEEKGDDMTLLVEALASIALFCNAISCSIGSFEFLLFSVLLI